MELSRNNVNTISRLDRIKRAALAVVALGGAAALVDGCSAGAALNPSKTASYSASPSAGATQEVKALYPSATDIVMHEATDNPDYMSWDISNNEYCTSVSSAVSVRGVTSGNLLTQPWCRDK